MDARTEEQSQDEPKTAQVTARVSERVKRAVQLLALLEDTTEGEILHEYALKDVVRVADERRAQIKPCPDCATPAASAA